MIFFVNDSLLNKKSGIDQAVIKRMQLFERQNIAYTYVTRDWSQNLHQQLNALGVSDRHLLNMFDYYQQMVDVQPTKHFSRIWILVLKIYASLMNKMKTVSLSNVMMNAS